MNDFTQIASHTPTPAAPNTFCAQTSCQAACEANPACQYYTGGEILYKRGPGSCKSPNCPDPNNNGACVTAGNACNGQLCSSGKCSGGGGGGGNGPYTPPDPAFDLVNSIKELQGLEQYLFQKLEDVNMQDQNNIDDQNEIIAQINNLSDLRNNLFGQLGKMYINLDKNSQIERSALTDQIVTTNMMERQLNNLKSDVSIILDQRTDKMRMVEIGEYEYLRYSAHKSAMKTLAFTSMVILVCSVLLKRKILPAVLPRMGIMAACAIGGVLLVKQVWGMATRDNQNYNRFTQPSADADYTGTGDTVWEHDKNFFYQLLHGAEADYKKGWGDLKHEWGELQQKLDQLKTLGDKNAFCATQYNPARKYDEQTNKCISMNGNGNGASSGPEGFQVVRAFKEGDKLDGAPFN